MEYKKILITGSSGLVGKSLQKFFPNATCVTSKDFDLSTREGVEYMLYKNPDCNVIIHCASFVGGIQINKTKPAEFITKNLLLNTFMIDLAYKAGIKRFIILSSSCAYPDKVEVYPMVEDLIFDGIPTPTNNSYAQSKRTMMAQVDAYNKQYNLQYQYLIPCNLYGEFDKYGDNHSHFIASLIKKIHFAKKNGDSQILLMGSGKSLRQFMHSDNLAFTIKYCLANDIYDNMNVATEENLSIKEMAKIALKSMDAEHLKIEFNNNGLDGQYRKDVSIEILKNKIPSFNPTPLEEGIRKTYSKLLELGTLDK